MCKRLGKNRGTEGQRDRRSKRDRARAKTYMRGLPQLPGVGNSSIIRVLHVEGSHKLVDALLGGTDI